MSRLNISKFLSVTASLILLSSCANMQAMIEEQAQEEKEISVEQKLQVSIPIPDNSRICGEAIAPAERITSLLQ